MRLKAKIIRVSGVSLPYLVYVFAHGEWFLEAECYDLENALEYIAQNNYALVGVSV